MTSTIHIRNENKLQGERETRQRTKDLREQAMEDKESLKKGDKTHLQRAAEGVNT